MICLACGTENPAGAKFCMNCASPLATACPSCGHVNPPAARFCMECATPLSADARPTARGQTQPASTRPPAATDSGAERRLVSVLFADLVGFTPFAEERDAEEVRETLTRYFDLARETIERYGGTVEKFIGDAVMAVWGAPTAQEDDAERAVRAALDLVDAVRQLGPATQARAAVLTGEAAVTVGAINQGIVAGDLVNTTARLQSVAEPGTVLVGEATQRAASESIVFEPVVEQTLKGKAAPVPAWRALRVVAQRRGRGRSDSLEAPFVGRDDEMRLLKDLFHATNRERRPRLVSVIGPGGIGKSRLAWEFLKYIDGLSEAVYWHDGRSPAYGEGITFWALGEMVRERAGLLESDDEPTTRAKLADSVRQHVPDEAERPTIERALLALLGFESGVDPQELFGAWRTFFERLAAVNPVVMVFEDLHFADTGLLDFIDHLLEWSRSSAITVVTLARPELLDKRANWGAGKRSFTSIYLEPLSDDEMRQLLAGLVPGLPEKAVAAIVGRADGIPLYAVETVRMLLADGRLVLEDGAYRPTGDLGNIAVPETLTALIAARLDALDSADRGLIADASVLGQSFTPAALAALAGVDAADLEPRLAGLLQRELLRREADPRSPERGQYAFVQALIREVAYNTLSKKDRKSRHIAAARFLEGLGSDEVAGALAGHYLAAYRAAGEGEDAEALRAQARVALRGAADRAAGLGSHAQALTLLEQALQVTTHPADRAELHERARAAGIEAVIADRALDHAQQAVAAWRDVGDRPAIAISTAALARLYLSIFGDPRRALDVLLPAWEEFADLEMTQAGVRLMVATAGAYARLDDLEGQVRWVDRVLPVAERLDLLDDLVAAWMIHGTTLNKAKGRPREALLILRGAHDIAIANGFRDSERIGRTLVTFFEQWSEPAAGLALGREGLEVARQSGSTAYALFMVGNTFVCAIRQGEWDFAAEMLAEHVPAGSANGDFIEFICDRAIMATLRGEDAAAELARSAELQATVTDPQFVAYEAWARAWAALSEGSLREATERARAAVDAVSFFGALATPVAARAALWANDVDVAREVFKELDLNSFRGQALSLDTGTIRAGILALEGSIDESVALYREMLRGWRAIKCAWDEALTVIDMVTLLGAQHADPSAVEWARETLVRLEARPYLERLEAALAAAPRDTKPADRKAALPTARG